MRVEHIGDATLVLADCMDVMRDMPDNAFELAIVDPPYGNCGLDRWSAGKETRFGDSGGRFKKYLEAGCDVSWDRAPPPEYFEELFRVSKYQIIFGGNNFSLPPSRNFIVWRKLIPENFTMAMAEYAWTNIPGNAKVFECASQGTVNNPRFHPAQKPAALYKWLLSRYAKHGDTILDTHGGSGSSVVACLDMGYPITWIEKDVNYFEAALKRIKDFAAQPKLPMNDTPEPVEQWLGFEEAL